MGQKEKTRAKFPKTTQNSTQNTTRDTTKYREKPYNRGKKQNTCSDTQTYQTPNTITKKHLRKTNKPLQHIIIPLHSQS